MLHGIPLSEIGSIRYCVIQEGILRERSEKLAFAKFLGEFLAPMSGVTKDKTGLLLAEYGEQLQQLSYNYKYETVRSRITVAHQSALAQDKQYLDRVAKMSVGD